MIRELAKFHAISYCMKGGSNDRLLDAYPYLQVTKDFFEVIQSEPGIFLLLFNYLPLSYSGSPGDHELL